MSRGYEVQLGPLTSTIADGARWRSEDEFPSSQLWADEVERILSFTQVQGQFENYIGALKGNKSQRGSALMELRVAFYFARNSFPINEWNPVGANSREGEYLLGCPSGADVFTEVKSPGWESELTEEERSAGRTVQPKYIDGEARSIAPWQALQFAVEKAYPKFLTNIPNLLVVADDLFIGLEHGTDTQAGMALYSRHCEGCFTDGRNERLGGVGIFWIVNNGKKIAYDMKLYINANSLEETKLPDMMASAFHGCTLPDNIGVIIEPIITKFD